MMKIYLLGFLFLVTSKAWAAPDAMTQQKAQLRDLRSHFEANGDWKGTTPEREVQWLAGTRLAGNEYSVQNLAVGEDQNACARLCVKDLYCTAFTFMPVDGTSTVPRCALKYPGYTVQTEFGLISGVVRSN